MCIMQPSLCSSFWFDGSGEWHSRACDAIDEHVSAFEVSGSSPSLRVNREAMDPFLFICISQYMQTISKHLDRRYVLQVLQKPGNQMLEHRCLMCILRNTISSNSPSSNICVKSEHASCSHHVLLYMNMGM